MGLNIISSQNLDYYRHISSCMNTETQIAIDKLKDLIQKDGVFYALLFSLYEDSHIKICKRPISRLDIDLI